MQSIYVKLNKDDPKCIQVSIGTGIALRRVIKSQFKALQRTDLRKIKFKGFKNGCLDISFYEQHNSADTALKVVTSKQIANPLHNSNLFEASGELLDLTMQLRISTSIYIRDCYKELYDVYMKYEEKTLEEQISYPSSIPHVYLTGSPGIGKTSFLLYLLHLMLKEKRKIIFGSKFIKGFLYWDSPTSVVYLEENDIVKYYKDRNITFLMDSREIKTAFGPCIICSSPRSDIAKQYRKTAYTLYMPVWEWDEIQHLHNAVYSNKISKMYLKARYFIAGGIPRYLFENLQSPAAKLIYDAIKNTETSHLKRLYESKGVNGEEISHKLIHQLSSNECDYPFTSPGFRYASDYVTSLIANFIIKSRINSVYDFLIEASIYGEFGTLRGSLFEGIGHSQIYSSGTFKLRDLEASTELIFVIPKLDLDIIATPYKATTWKVGYYHKPISKNFECLDAWAMIDGELWGFQFTVSYSHKISSAIYWYYKNWGLKHYVTVVYDLDIFNSYSKTKVTASKKGNYPNIEPDGFDVKQYVMHMDCQQINDTKLWELQETEFALFVGPKESLCQQTIKELELMEDSFSNK